MIIKDGKTMLTKEDVRNLCLTEFEEEKKDYKITFATQTKTDRDVRICLFSLFISFIIFSIFTKNLNEYFCLGILVLSGIGLLYESYVYFREKKKRHKYVVDVIVKEKLRPDFILKFNRHRVAEYYYPLKVEDAITKYETILFVEKSMHNSVEIGERTKVKVAKKIVKDK